MGGVGAAATDGRRARRERNRIAVIDAMFALVNDGKVPLRVEDVAEGAGISVSSVFRIFDGLDDLQRQAFDRFQARYHHLLDEAPATEVDRAERVRRHVGSRVELFSAAGPLLRLARQRAVDYQPMAEGVARMRTRLADHTRRHFAVEASRLTPAGASNLLAVVDAATSPEAFEVMSAVHGRTPRQIAATWIRLVEVLLADWAGPDVTPDRAESPR